MAETLTAIDNDSMAAFELDVSSRTTEAVEQVTDPLATLCAIGMFATEQGLGSDDDVPTAVKGKFGSVLE